MGFIQPGVGYNLISSPEGDSLEIIFPEQAAPYGPEQFKVEVNGNALRVANGTVITQDVWEDTYKDSTTVQFDLYGVWAYVTGTKTVGTDTSSVWMDNGGHITLSKASVEGGSDSWGVYIVRQPLNKVGQKHTPEVIVIQEALGAYLDAYEKTTPWGSAETTDSIRLYSIANATSVTVDGDPAGNFITTFDPNPSQYNYNCQRVKVASVTWDSFTSSWTVIQHIIGTVTLPNIIQYYGVDVAIDGVRPDDLWPNYEAECNDWNGAWTGYTKSSLPTSGIIVPPGFPA